MPVRRQIIEKQGIYFITFTCYNWLPLFAITHGYDSVYRQFDYLQQQGHFIIGYIIMPNHVHAIIGFRNCGKSINSILANIKRFMAYEIIAKLTAQNNKYILQQLAAGVNAADKRKGQLHEVFEPSFDAKFCYNEKVLEQKLAYLHRNPNRGKWRLCENPADYEHSSAKFYFTGEQGIYPVTSYMLMKDINLTGD